MEVTVFKDHFPPLVILNDDEDGVYSTVVLPTRKKEHPVAFVRVCNYCYSDINIKAQLVGAVRWTADATTIESIVVRCDTCGQCSYVPTGDAPKHTSEGQGYDIHIDLLA